MPIEAMLALPNLTLLFSYLDILKTIVLTELPLIGSAFYDKMPKRIASSQITHDNWDDEEEVDDGGEQVRLHTDTFCSKICIYVIE